MRDLTGQIPNDQHKLDWYAEICDNYNMSQSKAQAFKTLIQLQAQTP